MNAITNDEVIFALERQARDLAAAWNHAADLLAEAEAACSAVLQDPDADDAAKDAAEARENLALAEADRLGNTLDELARRICATPVETLDGLACKAQVALWLEMDGLARAGAARPCPLSGRTPWIIRRAYPACAFGPRSPRYPASKRPLKVPIGRVRAR